MLFDLQKFVTEIQISGPAGCETQPAEGGAVKFMVDEVFQEAHWDETSDTTWL